METGRGVAACEIEVCDVSRVFGRRLVLDRVSGRVTTGQVVAAVGPNGSGKSTLLRIVAGILQPTSGEVRVTVNSDALDPVSRRRCLCCVAPDTGLYAELTGVENLEFLAGLRGIRPSHDDLARVLSTVGLLGRGRDKYRHYSSGMKQRLKLALAELIQPDILLLDEPCSNLDVAGKEMVAQLVARFRTRSCVLMATNEAEEISWADSVLPVISGVTVGG